MGFRSFFNATSSKRFPFSLLLYISQYRVRGLSSSKMLEIKFLLKSLVQKAASIYTINSLSLNIWSIYISLLTYFYFLTHLFRANFFFVSVSSTKKTVPNAPSPSFVMHLSCLKGNRQLIFCIYLKLINNFFFKKKRLE